MKTRHLWLFALIFFHLLSTQAHALPFEQLTPGGVALVSLPSIGPAEPRVHYHQIPVTTIQRNTHWVALVGIPLSAKPGPHEIVARWGENGPKSRHSFTVTAKAYPEQRLTIKNKRKVNPNPADMERIGKEQQRIRQARHSWRHTTPALTLQLPVVGRESSQFGLRRFFNNQARKPHGGLDIAAPTGTPVYAPAAGQVVETGDYFFSGNCIFINHGQGLVTFYAHLHRIDVKPGQLIQAGDKIGEVGATGRVTGPHLHWSVGLNRTWVEPKLFLPTP